MRRRAEQRARHEKPRTPNGGGSDDVLTCGGRSRPELKAALLAAYEESRLLSDERRADDRAAATAAAEWHARELEPAVREPLPTMPNDEGDELSGGDGGEWCCSWLAFQTVAPAHCEPPFPHPQKGRRKHMQTSGARRTRASSATCTTATGAAARPPPGLSPPPACAASVRRKNAVGAAAAACRSARDACTQRTVPGAWWGTYGGSVACKTPLLAQNTVTIICVREADCRSRKKYGDGGWLCATLGRRRRRRRRRAQQLRRKERPSEFGRVGVDVGRLAHARGSHGVCRRRRPRRGNGDLGSREGRGGIEAQNNTWKCIRSQFAWIVKGARERERESRRILQSANEVTIRRVLVEVLY